MHADSQQHLTLDAMLPLAIAAFPVIAFSFFPAGHMVQVAAAIVAPILSAFLRAAIGIHQLESINQRQPSISRGLMFAAAILILLVAQVWVSALQFVKQPPLSIWFYPAALFCVYLVLIENALHTETEESFDIYDYR